MTYTENYNLKKPAQTEFVNVDDLNDNADAIDEQMKVNAYAISVEATRAKAAEDTLTKNLSAEATRATAAESANASNISALQTSFNNLWTVVHTW